MSNENNTHREIAPENRRDTSADKRKIKKALIVIVCVLAVLCLLAGALSLVTKLLEGEVSEVSYDDYRFFEADYNKNIMEDKLYLSLDRAINFERFGTELVLTQGNAADIAPAADLFYRYINCIIMGDYQSYTSFFTSECLNSDKFKAPERFTMQGLYDINIKLFRADSKEINGVDGVCEIYEVSYRIFENNGTFRNDILPDETRTLVFEIYVTQGVAWINAIGHRANG